MNRLICELTARYCHLGDVLALSRTSHHWRVVFHNLHIVDWIVSEQFRRSEDPAVYVRVVHAAVARRYALAIDPELYDRLTYAINRRLQPPYIFPVMIIMSPNAVALLNMRSKCTVGDRDVASYLAYPGYSGDKYEIRKGKLYVSRRGARSKCAMESKYGIVERNAQWRIVASGKKIDKLRTTNSQLCSVSNHVTSLRVRAAGLGMTVSIRGTERANAVLYMAIVIVSACIQVYMTTWTLVCAIVIIIATMVIGYCRPRPRYVVVTCTN